MQTLTVDGRAPDFILPDQAGKVHRLSDYHGKWLALYFYPKDSTPGCTEQACRLRDDYLALRQLGLTVVGISLDKADSHARFAHKHALPFTLLSDEQGVVAKAYGALWSFGPVKFAKRHTFIIDPFGRIAKIYRKVTPKTHSGELIRDLTLLRMEPR